MTSLGEASTVKVFAVGDIGANPPGPVSVVYATVNVQDPLNASLTIPQSHRVIDNAYYSAKSQGLIPDTVLQSDWEWDELGKNPDKYLHVDNHTPTTITDIVAFEGSGAVVASDGLILTNAHVVSDGTAQVISPVMEIFQQLLTLLIKDLGPMPADQSESESINLGILKWLVSNTPETFTFKEARVYLDDRSDTLDEKLKLAMAASKDDPKAMDNFIKEISIPATILQKGTPWPGDDVAILKVDASNLISLPLADATSIQNGEPIHCFGYPGAAMITGLAAGDQFRAVQKQGTIGQSMPMSSGYDAYNISADINHGNSGGPVVDAYGQIIGLGTAGNPSDNGENYAVPVSLIKTYLDKAKASIKADDQNTLWYDGLVELSKSNKKAALKDFQQLAQAQGASPGASVFPGTVNRWVVEAIHHLQDSRSGQ